MKKNIPLILLFLLTLALLAGQAVTFIKITRLKNSMTSSLATLGAKKSKKTTVGKWKDKPRINPDFFDKLKKGGYTIFIRHAAKDPAVGISLSNVRRSLDRGELISGIGPHPTYKDGTCLSESGKAEAWLIGKVFEKYDIPVGEIYSSKICRVLQTAQIVFPNRQINVKPELAYINLGRTDKDRYKMLEDLEELVLSPPKSGTNKLIFGHGKSISYISKRGNSQPIKLKDIKEAGISFIKYDKKGKIADQVVVQLEELMFGIPLTFEKQ